jgi:hypothetical protein
VDTRAASALVNRWIQAKKLQRSAHRNVKELAADILAWARTWNENPRPFVWTKTAEQILERLAGYCAARQHHSMTPFSGRFSLPGH